MTAALSAPAARGLHLTFALHSAHRDYLDAPPDAIHAADIDDDETITPMSPLAFTPSQSSLAVSAPNQEETAALVELDVDWPSIRADRPRDK